MIKEELTIHEAENGLMLEWGDYTQVIEKDSSEDHMFVELGIIFHQIIEHGMANEETVKAKVSIEITKDGDE